MTIAADLVLISVDPATGRNLLGSSESDPVVGGAVLVDLVLAERCAIEGEGKKARVQLVDPRPVGSAPHDRALGRVRPGRNQRASSLVPRLGKGTRALLLDQLVAAGALGATPTKVLWIFPSTRHHVVDTVRRDALVAAVLEVLRGEADPDDTTGPLVGLLSAGGAVRRLVPRHERKAAVRRGREIARGEWSGAAAQAAITAASTAVTAAVTAAVATSAAGADGGGA